MRQEEVARQALEAVREKLSHLLPIRVVSQFRSPPDVAQERFVARPPQRDIQPKPRLPRRDSFGRFIPRKSVRKAGKAARKRTAEVRSKRVLKKPPQSRHVGKLRGKPAKRVKSLKRPAKLAKPLKRGRRLPARPAKPLKRVSRRSAKPAKPPKRVPRKPARVAKRPEKFPKRRLKRPPKKSQEASKEASQAEEEEEAEGSAAHPAGCGRGSRHGDAAEAPGGDGFRADDVPEREHFNQDCHQC